MNRDEREKLFLESVKRELDAGVERLDEKTLLCLRKARQRALAEAENSRWRFVVPRWLTAGGLATAMLVVVAVSFWPRAPREGFPVRQAEDVEILAAQENLDISRDLDFYCWLTAVDNER